MNRINKILIGLTLSLASVAVALLILEGMVRLLGLGATGIMRPHEQFGWFHRPGVRVWNSNLAREYGLYVDVNSQGLRDDEYAYAKEADVFRILVLGDSFMEAIQVPLEASFAKILERKLNATGQVRFEVINAGVGGYGTDNELLFFRHQGFKYEADLVILAFLPANDIMNNAQPLEDIYSGPNRKPYFILDQDSLQLRNFPYHSPQQGITGAVRTFLYRHSQLYGLVREILGKRRATGQTEFPLYFMTYAAEPTPEWKSAWSLTERLLVELARDIREQGADLIVLGVTANWQVDETFWQSILVKYPAMQQLSWDITAPDRRLIDWGVRNSVPVYWLLPAFRQAYDQSPDQPLHFYHDGHWTPHGHELAAQLVFDYLSENNLIPDTSPGVLQD